MDVSSYGKTNMFLVALLYRWVYAPGQFLVVYPNDGLAAETNQQKLNPLISHIPQLAAEMTKPKSFRSDRYKFSDSTLYFQGAGSKIVSKSCSLVIGDEVDVWSIENRQAVQDLEKRTRSYKNSLQILVCTPSTQNGHIWQSFVQGSQGYYTLRCQRCGELTMRSCDVHNLQFESRFNEDLRSYQVIPGTERLVCPKCGYEHPESMKHDMICQGDYVFKVPEMTGIHDSFQVGALASQLPALSWLNTANAQLQAGKTSDLGTLENFDNSWRGLPYRPRKVTKDEIVTMKSKHLYEGELKQEDIVKVLMVADTMDDFLRYAVVIWDIHDCMHFIEIGTADYFTLIPEKRAELNRLREQENKPPVLTLDDILAKTYLNEKISIGLIDSGRP